jgi:hypothetical protein
VCSTQSWAWFFVISSGNVTLHPFDSGAAAILKARPEQAERVERETSLNVSEKHGPNDPSPLPKGEEIGAVDLGCSLAFLEFHLSPFSGRGLR